MKMTVGCAWLKVRKVQITAFLLDEQSLHKEANLFSGRDCREVVGEYSWV
jgi:hypothetical protein